MSALWAPAQPPQPAQPVPLPEFFRRPMGTRDLDAVATIEARCYSFPWTRGNFLDALAAGYDCQVLHTPATGVLAYFVAMQGVDELHLLNVSVAPDWQGRGLGSQLLQVVCGLGRQQGLSMLWLEVRSSNQRARALYRARGFAEVGLRKSYYPAATAREDAIVMSLRLLDSGPQVAP